MAKDQFEIRTGMDVVDKDGTRVGALDSILSEDETGISRFVTLESKLVPVEALEGVEDGRVKLTVDREKLEEFPTRHADEMPTPDDQEQAYRVLGLTGPMTGEE